MIRSRILITSIVFLSPLSFVEASLRINEIAWQGYLGDANNEWIELYNDGETTNLDGWVLQAEDGTPSINLSGVSVSSGDFVLLERTDDTSVPEALGDVFYSGALSNEGENLVLKNADGQVIDSADFSSGWEMESASTYILSWFGSGWAEGFPSPKEVNSPVDEEDVEEDNNEETSEDEEGDDETEVASVTTGGNDKKIVTYKDRKATIEAEKYGFVGVPFSVASYLRDLDGGEIRKGFYAWNMGDGTVYYKGKKGEFTHVYQYPGEYVVSLSYNRATFGQEPDELDPLIYDEHIVTVSEEALSIESFSGGAVTLKNNSKHTMNIEDWVITNNDVRFTIPKNTMLRAGKTLTFPGSLTKLEHNPVFIMNPTGSIVDHASKEPKPESRKEGVVLGAETSYEEESLEDIDFAFTEEEIFSLEHDDEEATSLPRKESSSWFTILFIVLLVLSGAVLWIMMSGRKKETHVEGYEIIED
jgi:hypothetical protein